MENKNKDSDSEFVIDMGVPQAGSAPIYSSEEKLVNALNLVIKVQADLIEVLKAEIQALKNQVLTSPNIVQMPYNPLVPLYPSVQPFYSPEPLIPNPLQPPYTITCTTADGTVDIKSRA